MNSIRAIRKVIIPVAGLGTLILPEIKAIPKELLLIYDMPIIEALNPVTFIKVSFLN